MASFLATTLSSAFSELVWTQASPSKELKLSTQALLVEVSSTPSVHPALSHNTGRRPSPTHGSGLTQQQEEETRSSVGTSSSSSKDYQRYFYGKWFSIKAFATASRKLAVVDKKHLSRSYRVESNKKSTGEHASQSSSPECGRVLPHSTVTKATSPQPSLQKH